MNLWKKYKDILKTKRLDIFTKNKKNNSVLDIIKKSEYDDFINLVAESYYSRLKSSKDNWKLEWENMCSREFDISNNNQTQYAYINELGSIGVVSVATLGISNVTLSWSAGLYASVIAEVSNVATNSL